MSFPTTAITVLLVDDQELFRSGIKMLIDSQPDMHVVAEASNGQEAIEAAKRTSPDVILMDLRMPVMDGVTATRTIGESASGAAKPKIIALTTFNMDQAILDAIGAGAKGYLLKSAEPEFLMASVRAVYSGYSVIASGSVDTLLASSGRGATNVKRDKLLSELSLREREVFHLAVPGASNAEIARSLFISEATVKTHMRSLLEKLGLSTRIQLIAFAYQHGLFQG